MNPLSAIKVIWADWTLTTNEKAFLVSCVLRGNNKTGKVGASFAMLGSAAGISDATVTRIMKRPRVLKYLRVVEKLRGRDLYLLDTRNSVEDNQHSEDNANPHSEAGTPHSDCDTPHGEAVTPHGEDPSTNTTYSSTYSSTNAREELEELLETDYTLLERAEQTKHWKRLVPHIDKSERSRAWADYAHQHRYYMEPTNSTESYEAYRAWGLEWMTNKIRESS